MHDLFRQKREIPTHDPYTGELNPYYEDLTGEKNPYEIKKEEYSNPTIEECVKMLEEKYMYSSTGDAYAINRLIEFYKENKI